ncbi:MOSC domain-containing protein [Stappia indica]|uniref:MOSC domain-containing protein n=1 Tax=Stappia indica TaxID=538381 RepID=UPI001D182B4C|nr:MOSC domain-containing protein [Stappia indica]MCC4244114.1 MOSC domain-containing protein [Stappia indica]
MASDLKTLMARHARPGLISWIGLRPARLAPVVQVDSAEASEAGLAGDHYVSGGKRAVTLLQGEHLPVIAALAALAEVDPAQLRRNVVVHGLNLAAVRHHPLRLGTALLRISGPCAPCSRMERVLGPGGYNAMRGHGGYYAEVLEPGCFALGDAVVPEARETTDRDI